MSKSLPTVFVKIEPLLGKKTKKPLHANANFHVQLDAKRKKHRYVNYHGKAEAGTPPF